MLTSTGLDQQAALEKSKRSLVDMGYAADLGDGRIRAPRILVSVHDLRTKRSFYRRALHGQLFCESKSH